MLPLFVCGVGVVCVVSLLVVCVVVVCVCCCCHCVCVLLSLVVFTGVVMCSLLVSLFVFVVAVDV